MGVISESAVWEDSVLQIEVGDSVGGGAGAVANLQAQDLANRTKFLKSKVDLLLGRGPVGALVTMPVNDVPDHCFECNGAEISRETYSELFAVIGTVYGAGDGSTTFKIPDLRGEFIRGWDNARGIDASRAIGSAQADAFKAHTHYYYHVGGDGAASIEGGSTYPRPLEPTGSTGGTETRPRNVAMMYCIVYE